MKRLLIAFIVAVMVSGVLGEEVYINIDGFEKGMDLKIGVSINLKNIDYYTVGRFSGKTTKLEIAMFDGDIYKKMEKLQYFGNNGEILPSFKFSNDDIKRIKDNLDNTYSSIDYIYNVLELFFNYGIEIKRYEINYSLSEEKFDFNRILGLYKIIRALDEKLILSGIDELKLIGPCFNIGDDLSYVDNLIRYFDIIGDEISLFSLNLGSDPNTEYRDRFRNFEKKLEMIKDAIEGEILITTDYVEDIYFFYNNVGSICSELFLGGESRMVFDLLDFLESSSYVNMKKESDKIVFKTANDRKVMIMLKNFSNEDNFFNIFISGLESGDYRIAWSSFSISLMSCYFPQEIAVYNGYREGTIKVSGRVKPDNIAFIRLKRTDNISLLQ